MREIIGVVGNVKHRSLRNEDTPEMYLPQTQIPFDTHDPGRAHAGRESRQPNECDSRPARRGRSEYSPNECKSL